MTLAFLALLGAPYIYDISSLRVKQRPFFFFLTTAVTRLFEIDPTTRIYLLSQIRLRTCANTLYTHRDKNVVCNGPAGWAEYGKESIRSGDDCSSAWQGHFTANTGIGNREAYIFKLLGCLSSVTHVLKAS